MLSKNFGLAIFSLYAAILLGQSATSFRYFYDDANELYRVLDSTGTLIEYTYDPSGNIVNVARTTLSATQLSILNVTPANATGGSTITILGQNFSAIAAGDTVMIGNVAATVLSASATQLVVSVPPGTAGGTISVTVNGVTATWSNTVAVAQPPFISSLTPASGKNGATVTVTVTGQNLAGATFALQSVDPTNTAAPGSVSVVSNTGTAATLTLVLSTTEGQFALIGTNAVGTSGITPGSLFLIGPVNNTVSSYLSVLNTGFDPSTNPPLPKSQNSVSAYASVLNTGYNSTTNPPFPPGHNLLSTYASVLNTGFDPSTNPTLPKGQNGVSTYASVLNTGYNSTSNPPFPAGQNLLSYYISVLNTGSYSSTVHSAFTLGVSVCNTAQGCTANHSALVSVNASPESTRPRTTVPTSPAGSTPRGSLPILEPVVRLTEVNVGQTIRLGARNVDPGASVEFDVNGIPVATVAEAPYETLFTVPDGVGDLLFQVIVREQGGPERLSQVSRITVLPDAGANISGTVAQGGVAQGGVELSLAAGGLSADYYQLAQPVTALPDLRAPQPVRSGYVTAINEPNPGSVFGDDPLGTHLASDYAVRFSGEVRADVAGVYRFWLAARSGAALLMDGKLLADSGFVTGQPAEAEVSLSLSAGWHRLEVVYYKAVGAASVRLDWQQPGRARREALGPEYLRTVLTGMSAVSAADGTFRFPPVPQRFDSVWIRVKQGDTFTEFPALKPGASSIRIQER